MEERHEKSEGRTALKRCQDNVLHISVLLSISQGALKDATELHQVKIQDILKTLPCISQGITLYTSTNKSAYRSLITD